MLNELGFAYRAQGRLSIAAECYNRVPLRFAVSAVVMPHPFFNDQALSIAEERRLSHGLTEDLTATLESLGRLQCDRCDYAHSERLLLRCLDLRQQTMMKGTDSKQLQSSTMLGELDFYGVVPPGDSSRRNDRASPCFPD